MTNNIVERNRKQTPPDYLMAARDLARQGLTGKRGDPLPVNMNTETVALISLNIPRFQMWVSIYSKEQHA